MCVSQGADGRRTHFGKRWLCLSATVSSGDSQLCSIVAESVLRREQRAVRLSAGERQPQCSKGARRAPELALPEKSMSISRRLRSIKIDRAVSGGTLFYKSGNGIPMFPHGEITNQASSRVQVGWYAVPTTGALHFCVQSDGL